MSQFKKYLEIVQESTPEERKKYKDEKRKEGTGYTWTPSIAGGRNWYLPKNPQPSDIANTIREYLDTDYSKNTADIIVDILKNSDIFLHQLEKNTRLKKEMSDFFGVRIVKFKDFIKKYDAGEIKTQDIHIH